MKSETGRIFPLPGLQTTFHLIFVPVPECEILITIVRHAGFLSPGHAKYFPYQQPVHSILEELECVSFSQGVS